MEQDNQNSTDLEQEIKNIKQSIRPTQMRNNNEISQQTNLVRNVMGLVKLASSPHYGLVLETGFAEKCLILPIIMVDSTKHINQWILAVGKKVWVDQLLVVYERFQNFEGCQDIECINVVVRWEDVKILEDSINLKETDCYLNQQLPINTKEETHLTANLDTSHSCRIMVHHVSSAFQTDQAPALCLVLISYTNKKQVEAKLWLVLKAEQVSWKEFLLPNREYIILLPEQSHQIWLDQYQKPLKELFTSSSRELDVIFHHQDLLPTLNGCFLPLGSRLFMTCNTQFSDYVHQFVSDTSCLWFSSNEADYADAGLITFYGQIDIIKYDYETVYKACYLCVKAKTRQPSMRKPNFTSTYSWTNPWTSKSSLDKDELLTLPISEADCSVMKMGVPGNLVQIIKLRDVITGEEQSVYLKHSYISRSQQVCRLSSGMVVCITHLNRRCSTRGKYYYIATVLTSFKVLSLPNNLCQNEIWGVYGLNCSVTPYYQDRMWGVLETINLTKVTITARCTNCNSLFYKGTCNEDCSLPTAKISALAIGFLQIIYDKNVVSMDKVIIKDDSVRELLCIPEDIWQIFLKVSVEQEMVCFFSNQEWSEPTTSLDFCELFRMYCFIPKPNGKFYISVKKVASYSDNDPVYYCIHLKPIEQNRLKILGELANKVSLG